MAVTRHKVGEGFGACLSFTKRLTKFKPILIDPPDWLESFIMKPAPYKNIGHLPLKMDSVAKS
jgi:hypothetical protein